MKSNVSSPASSSVPVVTLPLDQIVPMWIASAPGEDRCDNCSCLLKETEKSVGLCGRCQKLTGTGDGDVEDFVPSVMMPMMQLKFAPAPPSSLLMLTSINMNFVPLMAKRRCPNGDGDRLKESSYPRGWKCSNPKCDYAKRG